MSADPSWCRWPAARPGWGSPPRPRWRCAPPGRWWRGSAPAPPPAHGIPTGFGCWPTPRSRWTGAPSYSTPRDGVRDRRWARPAPPGACLDSGDRGPGQNTGTRRPPVPRGRCLPLPPSPSHGEVHGDPICSASRSRYTTVVSQIPLRELRAATSGILRRVEAGESIVVTVDRRPVATLVPFERRLTWVPARQVWARIQDAAADAGLTVDLDRLIPDRLTEL